MPSPNISLPTSSFLYIGGLQSRESSNFLSAGPHFVLAEPRLAIGAHGFGSAFERLSISQGRKHANREFWGPPPLNGHQIARTSDDRTVLAHTRGMDEGPDNINPLVITAVLLVGIVVVVAGLYGFAWVFLGGVGS